MGERAVYFPSAPNCFDVCRHSTVSAGKAGTYLINDNPMSSSKGSKAKQTILKHKRIGITRLIRISSYLSGFRDIRVCKWAFCALTLAVFDPSELLLLLPLHSFNGLLSRTTWVSRYQKGKTSLACEMMGFWDGSGISWTICKQSAPRSRQINTPI